MSRLAQTFGFLALWAISSATAFSVAPSSSLKKQFLRSVVLGSSPGEIKSTVISPDDEDFEFDTGLGGVRLAQESAVKMIGTIKHKGGSATASFKELERYRGVKEVSDSQVQEVLKKVGGSVICTGSGQELYKDPGDTLEKVVKLGPIEAAEDAWKGATPAVDAAEIIINVLGGDDLQFLEVKDALELLVPKLAIGKAKVRFNSLCHSSFPMEQVTITAVALPSDASSNGLSGVEQAVADGEVYFRDGKWWTVIESDINTALA